MDDNAGEIHTAPSVSDPTFERGDDTVADLGNWFSRPIRIQKYTWSEGANLTAAFNPWHDYFSHPEIYAKVKGFCRLRCKLHVKLIINASPFQYSLGIMSYRPLCGDGTIPAFSGGELANYTTVINDVPSLMAYTQYPHAHFMPQLSKGCEMELPFIYFKDWLPLTSSALTHLRDMGRMVLVSYDLLRTASTSTSANPISVSIYAWASDVQLAGPSMSLQADEYAERPVSTVASAIAAAAGALQSIPPLAPFARATMMVANGIGSVARFFGFSNPPVIDPVHNMRISYAANLCSPDIPTQIEKLSMDPKNELTVDSRTVGLDGTDHMEIRHMLNRDVYFSTVLWQASDAPDVPLFAMDVNPAVSDITSVTGVVGNGVKVQMTPSALLSQMFAHWRGPITIKFVAACSAFHRGRLRISYDPNGRWGNTDLGTARLYQKVWDLSTANTFEYQIPFMAPSTYLSTFRTASDGSRLANKFWEERAASAGITYSAAYFNGCIRVDVMNELTAPAAVDVPIFVYINAANVEFANPISLNSTGQFTHAVLQSLEVDDTVQSETIPVVDKIDHRNDVYMGERIVSTRQLIHRASYWDTLRPSYIGAPDNATFSPTTSNWRSIVVKWIFPRLPMPFAIFPSYAAGGAPANGWLPWNWWGDFGTFARYGTNCRTTPLSLLSMCYVGWRGSVVWRGFLEGTNQPVDSGIHIDELAMSRDLASPAVLRPASLTGISAPANFEMNVLRGGAVVKVVDGGADPTADTTATGWIALTNVRLADVYSDLDTKAIGVSRACPDNTPNIEAVVPQYSNLRMHAGNPNYYVPAASGYSTTFNYATVGDTNDNVSLTARLSTGRGTTPASVFSRLEVPPIDMYVHGGVDFTNFMFLAVPTLYRYTSTTAGVLPTVAPQNDD